MGFGTDIYDGTASAYLIMSLLLMTQHFAQR